MPSENLLKQVGVDRPVAFSQESKKTEDAATAMLLLGLKTLSQRLVVALSKLFTLLTCASAFVLWENVLPNPNSYQLTGLGLYGAFLLLLHLVIRKNG